MVLNELTVDGLYKILKNPYSTVILGKKLDFRAYGIDIKFEDRALRLLAERAAKEKTGARGLVSVLERVLIQFEKRLPSTEIKELVVTPEMVSHPDRELELLLNQPEQPGLKERFHQAGLQERELLRHSIRRREQELLRQYQLPLTESRLEMLVNQYLRWDGDLKAACEELGRLHQQVHHFEERFVTEHQLQLHFAPEAVDEILQRALDCNVAAFEICMGLSKDLELALKLVRDRTAQDTFLLTREALLDLDAYLNRIIRDYYHQSLFREQ